MNILEFIRANILHVLPILIAGAFGTAIILERLKALYQTYPLANVEEFFSTVTTFVMAGKIREATELCDRYPTKPIAKVVKTALLRAHLPETVIEDGLHVVTNESAQVILKRTGFLATIANVATLLGLLGTIAGLIHSFEAVGHADAQQKAALLSAGIATAMNATMMGLGVAIPCMIAFSFLISRSNRMVSEIQTSAVRIIDILKQRYYASEHFDEVLKHTQSNAELSNGHSPHPATQTTNGADQTKASTTSTRRAS